MSDFRYEVDIQAPPARVWSVLLDVERWPEWTTSVTSIKRLDFGPLTLGSRTSIVQPRLSKRVWRVSSLDETHRSFAWTTQSLGLRIVGYHRVEESDTGASHVTLSLHFLGVLGPLIARLFRDLNRDYLAREGNGLKAHCEVIPWPSALPLAQSRQGPS
jgi:hypothetical protein